MLGWIKQSGDLIVLVRAVVHAIEALKGSAPGPEKRAAAVDMVMALWPYVERELHIDLDDARVRAAIGTLIDDVVLMENLLRDLHARRLTGQA